MSWPTGKQPFGVNHAPLLTGLDMNDGETEVPIAVDPSNGEVQTNASGGGGSLPSTILSGQQAVTASAVALPAGTLTEGVIITGLSTNSISVFLGPSGVTTSNGAELQPGAALSAAVANLDDIYVIASTTGATVTWLGS